MIDVLFINHSSQSVVYQKLAKSYAAIEPSTWSLLLAQSCRSKGFSVAILDCDAERLNYVQAIKRINELRPRLACFITYGQTPNSGTMNMVGTIGLASSLREEYPDIPIMSIGSHTSALPMEVLSWPFVDFIAINEGVYTLHALLQTDFKHDLDKVPGLGYKDGINHLNVGKIVPQEKMDIDLPGYAWDLLPYKDKPLDLYRSHFWHSEFDHEKRTPFAAIYSSLGCQFKCNFCCINIVNRISTTENISAEHSNIMRFWSPEFIIKEFDKLAELGVRTLRISDEMFYLNRKYFEPLLTLLSQRDYIKDMCMWAYSRIDTVREKYLELFRKASIKWLALGIESQSQIIRKEVSKGTFKEINIREVTKQIRDSDINVIANYIFGLPEDTQETMQATLDLSLELNTETANYYPCMALPGSPLYLASLGKTDLPTKFSEWSFLSYDSKPLSTKTLSSADVLRFRDNAWSTYFNRPEYLNMIEKRLGMAAKNNIIEMSKIKLKRKILGD